MSDSTYQSTYRGGCLCGRVRYACDAPPIDSGYCHCRMCQRSGAPVLAWAAFPLEGFRYLGEEPKVFRSSNEGQREFCPSCGAQIAYRGKGDRTVDVNLGTLDDPAAIRPEYHIWTDSRIDWFETVDDLPRFPDAGPDAAPR